MITKLKHIVRGWWFVLFDTKETRALNRQRKIHCDVCPFKGHYINLGFFKIGEYCRDCGCYNPAKRRVKEEACPQFKW